MDKQQRRMEEILWEAYHSTYGISLDVNSIDQVKRLFYTTRAKARERGIVAFEILSLYISPIDPAGQVWIIKREDADNATKIEPYTGEGDDQVAQGGQGIPG